MKTISQRELRNQSGEIMRALERGESFLITRHGVPVGELRPAPRRSVTREQLLAALAGAPPMDSKQFRADLDAVVDQSIEPRT
jgi:prevent-host-death family protein